MSLTTFYDVLGVTEDATGQEIGQGYRRLAASLHADKLQDMPDEVRHVCEERLKQIGEAYDVLKRPELREKYDRLLTEEREKEKLRQQAQQAAATASSVPPNPVNQAQQPSSGPYYAGQSAAQSGPAHTAPVGVPPAAQWTPAAPVSVYRPDRYEVLWPKVRTILGIVLVALFLLFGLSLKTIISIYPPLKQWMSSPEPVIRRIPRRTEHRREYRRSYHREQDYRPR